MYNYETQKSNIFTEDGQVMFLKIRDKAHELINVAGAFMMAEVIRGCSGESWDMLACVDRLVELGEIREVTGENVPGQCRVFVGGKNAR
jgi:hypothetical protein